MNQASAVSIAALGLGGAALALSLLRAPAAPSGGAPPLPSVDAPDPATAARLLARLDDLDRAQRELEGRLAMLEAGVTTAPRKPASSPLESSLEASLLTLYERAIYGVRWASGEVQEKSDLREIEQESMTSFLTDLGGFLTPQQLEDYLALQGDVFPGGEDGGK